MYFTTKQCPSDGTMGMGFDLLIRWRRSHVVVNKPPRNHGVERPTRLERGVAVRHPTGYTNTLLTRLPS